MPMVIMYGSSAGLEGTVYGKPFLIPERELLTGVSGVVKKVRDYNCTRDEYLILPYSKHRLKVGDKFYIKSYDNTILCLNQLSLHCVLSGDVEVVSLGSFASYSIKVRVTNGAIVILNCLGIKSIAK